MRTREEIEILEEETLAPYAMKSKDSSGRLYKEPLHNFRTCYQRDRDRIVHSEAFRKLEYKTQVFVIIEGDYYRTRLTHTIEVAQIARTIGRNLKLNEDLIEAIALGHDLGHPPFGHAGEEVLNEILQKMGGFSHNYRSYEIVNKFEKRYPEFDGLNLTKEVLVGILKHETDFDKAACAEGLEDNPTLEAQVVDIADSLAYLNHDVDDGLTSGCIAEEDLIENTLWEAALKKCKPKVTDNNPKILRYQIIKELIDKQVRDLLVASSKELEDANLRSSHDVKKHKHRIINFSSDMIKARTHLRDLLMEKFYHHYRVNRMTAKAKRIIKEIFAAYNENLNQLSPSIYDKTKKYSEKEKCRIICNYIASMTDRYALDEHKRFFDPYEKV